MTSTVQLECMSALVRRILVIGSMLGKINHVHFLAAMVADHIKKGLIVTSADIAQIPREALVPRAQAVVGTTASSKRGWLQHVKETARKWSRPIVRLAARPKPEAKPQSRTEAKPAAKRRPGALKAALLATAATAATSLPRGVPLMHTQEDFNRFVIKVAPEGSLQGFRIPYIEDLINMEPCTLWGRFLFEECEEYAFSGPQVRACRGQQPGALSNRALQPLLAQALGRRQHSNLASSWPVLVAPLRRGGFTEDMLFSAAWSVQNRTSQEQRLQETAAFAETIGDERGSPPTLPCRHQRCSGHHHHAFDQVAGQHAANETIARSQLGEHH